MFGRKDYVKVVEKLTEATSRNIAQLSAAKAEADRLERRVNETNQLMAQWGRASELMQTLEALRTDLIRSHEEICRRTGYVENEICRLLQRQDNQDRVFRVLGVSLSAIHLVQQAAVLAGQPSSAGAPDLPPEKPQP